MKRSFSTSEAACYHRSKTVNKNSKNLAMADDKADTSGTTGMQYPGLEADASILGKLGKTLAAAVKSRAFGRPEFAKQIEEASKLAGQINWNEVKANIDREASAVRTRNEANLSSRREKLLQAASAAKWPGQMGDQLDRVDIFQVQYEGAMAVIRLGGVVLERVNESDGEKLFARLQQLRASLEQTPYLRESFFKMLRDAHTICRFASGGGDEFVPVGELHREMVLEHARHSERFRKSAEPKNIEPYSLPQFVFDLARFVRVGVAVGAHRLVTQTPSMRESKETIHIPNLDHPTGSEVAAARLAIKPV